MSVHEARREVAAPPAEVARAVLDPDALPRWLRGARLAQVDAGWPAAGTTMAWTVGPTRFRARVVQDGRPGRLVQEVETPSARSRVTYTFAPAGAGRTLLAKRVEVLEARGLLGKVLLPLVLGGAVRREVARAARLAEGT